MVKRGENSLGPARIPAGLAHQQDTLHRNLKPANILIDNHGQPHVTDFGLAKLIAAEESPNELAASGQVLGTPGYMSPEQAAGKQEAITSSTDIYALGAVLYACLTGWGEKGE